MPRGERMENESATKTLPAGSDAAFVEDLYFRFLDDPKSVDPSWQELFGAEQSETDPARGKNGGASWGRSRSFQFEEEITQALRDVSDFRSAAMDIIRARMLIRAFRVRGHLHANLDPLDLAGDEQHPELTPEYYGFTEAEFDRPIFLDNALGKEQMTVREICDFLNRTYSANIGYEFMHIQIPEQRAWLQVRIEDPAFHPKYSPANKRALLQQLTEAEGLERFLGLKYTGTKRFGVDGAESLIPIMEAIADRAAQKNVEEIIIGMPHRGRLNILANTLKKPVAAILSEFEGVPSMPGDVQGSGDVKYHLGTSTDREFNGRNLHLSLTANPSHLEAVDPVVAGKVRAKQTHHDGHDYLKAMGVLMHGDAAFAGQGIVAECLGLSELKGYKTGGTIHVIVNNQIGFTTNPGFSRSSPYPSDVAKGVQAPILHVNGDDPEAVTHVAKIATDFRVKFGRDVVIDMFCYRRFGHNEGDEPSFTQPVMYKKISEHPPVREIYADRLVAEGVMTKVETNAMASDHHAYLEKEFEAAKSYRPNKADWLEGKWSGMRRAGGGARRGKTSVKRSALVKVGKALAAYPEGFDLHRTLRRVMTRKAEALENGAGIDWATAEALAFGTLLLEGHPVRLSGQDCGRGTFSHRHSVLTGQSDEAKHIPLNNIADGQAEYTVVDSMLSEMAVLGFEYGFSLAEPNALVLWEAQFGDFANGAQVIIDQFIASAESKWLRMSGLVLLLPHGQEGQGPEHSSARPERYLQLCAEENMQVINPTTPASYFHALRRQMHRDFRKPLIVMSPKSLLRHKRVTSTFEDFIGDRSFHRVLWDDHEDLVTDKKIRRIVLCAGKVYYELLEAKEKRDINDVYVLRLEQIYPFPDKALAEELARFPNAEILWCQEEPRNAGAWTFVEPRLEDLFAEIGSKTSRPGYAGPPAMASPAPGSMAHHKKQMAQLVDDALII